MLTLSCRSYSGHTMGGCSSSSATACCACPLAAVSGCCCCCCCCSSSSSGYTIFFDKPPSTTNSWPAGDRAAARRHARAHGAPRRARGCKARRAAVLPAAGAASCPALEAGGWPPVMKPARLLSARKRHSSATSSGHPTRPAGTRQRAERLPDRAPASPPLLQHLAAVKQAAQAGGPEGGLSAAFAAATHLPDARHGRRG